MDREELIRRIQAAAESGRLSCETARQLAVTLGVPLREIGALCNELKIKISDCGLGCF
jgi:hypothetical protein